jgi:hypothetical protein
VVIKIQRMRHEFSVRHRVDLIRCEVSGAVGRCGRRRGGATRRRRTTAHFAQLIAKVAH